MDVENKTASEPIRTPAENNAPEQEPAGGARSAQDSSDTVQAHAAEISQNEDTANAEKSIPDRQPVISQQQRTAEPGRNRANASLVLGILSCVFSLFPIAGIILGIIGIIMSSSARRQRHPATAGLVLSIIGIVLSILIWIISALLLSYSWVLY